MTEALLLQGGMVMSPGGPSAADVLIRDGVVVGVGNDFTATDVRVVDCAGAWVGPGFVDLHVHFREPGQEWKEDIATGSAAAAAGGFTAVVAMPNTDPAIDSGHLARYVADRGAEAGIVEVAPSGCITMGRQGEKLAHLDELWDAGVRIFTDDGDTVADAGVLRRAMEYLRERGAVIAQHAVDPGLARGGHMHEGEVSSRLGMVGIPAEAEEIIIARDIALTRLTGARYHVQHLSTAAGVRLVAQAKEEGLPVTAEVTPHHLAFDHRDAWDTDPVFKMMPPLRTDRDVQELRRALASGVIDVVATDHAPHAAVEKDVPFEHAPFGVTGLQTAAAVVNTYLDPTAELLFRRMSVAAAEIAGLPDQGNWLTDGAPANVVVFDPHRHIVAEQGPSKSANSPFLGSELRGHVRATVASGRLVHGGVE